MVEPVLRTMALILGAQVAGLAALERATPRTGRGIWLAPRTNAPKRATELWFLRYAAVWIGAFALIIGLGLYERFTAWTYLGVCGGLALPLALQPFLYPGLTREADRPLAQRYALKANVWLAIFGWVGNYWYTHYFYSVLGAAYTMPAHRVNGVPWCMFFATHFYFCFYHVLSNCALRFVATGYAPGPRRAALRAAAVLAMAYFTAFAETLTISGFPYYTFADRGRAYTPSARPSTASTSSCRSPPSSGSTRPPRAPWGRRRTPSRARPSRRSPRPWPSSSSWTSSGSRSASRS